MAQGGEGAVDGVGADLGVARFFADMARRLADAGDESGVLQAVCALAVAMVEGCEHASVSVADGRQTTTAAASGETAEQLDRLQYETGQGPCLEAIDAHAVFRIDDLRAETRWPRFSHRAVEETSARSMLSFQLFRRSTTMGALNLSSDRPGGLGTDAEEFGTVFAAHAAVALAGAKDRANLEHAVETRQVIGEAVGMMMARQGVDAEAAFDMLRRASQRMNVKVRDIARRVVESGPEGGQGPPSGGPGGSAP